MNKKNVNKKSPAQLKEIYGKEYVENYVETHSPYRIERLMKYIHLGSSYHVADFACGNGMLMSLVAPKVASYVGVDFSEEFIKEANQKKQLLGIKNADFFAPISSTFVINTLSHLIAHLQWIFLSMCTMMNGSNY